MLLIFKWFKYWLVSVSILIYSFVFIAIIIFIGKMDCLESCVQNWIETHHTISWLLHTVAPPWSRGSSCRCFFWPFSIFPPQEHLLWHRFTTDPKKSNIQLPTSNNQQPTLFWTPNTRNLVFITTYCYMVTYTIFW